MLSTFKMGLLTSASLMKKAAHRHDQRLVPWGSLDIFKLIITNHHTIFGFLAYLLVCLELTFQVKALTQIFTALTSQNTHKNESSKRCLVYKFDHM